MSLTDPLPKGPGQGLSILFNAGQFAARALNGPKRIQLDTLEVDCTLSEAYAYEADVTEFEVEKGANVSDHRRTKPVELSIAGLISDTPLDQDVVQEAIAAAAPQLGLAVSALSAAQGLLASDAIFTRDAFNKLERLYQVGREVLDGTERSDGTFSIVTKFRTFDNMVVKSLRISRETGIGMALAFAATFRELRFVETATASVAANPILQSPSSLGSQGGDDASQKLKDDGKTALFRMSDAGLTGGLSRADRFLKDKLLGKPGQ
jgi:hypothetical protein